MRKRRQLFIGIIIATSLYIFWSNFTISTNYVNNATKKYGEISDALVFTVAIGITDGFKRYIRSADHFHIPVQALGMSEKRFKGLGQKLNLLRKALEPYKLDKNRIVLFTDGNDVVFSGSLKMIIERFKIMNAKLVVSTDVFPYPDRSLALDYPSQEQYYKYLNSGGFIGYAANLYDLLRSHQISDKANDQRLLTNVYLNKTLKEKYKIKLDHSASIFQSLCGAEGDVKLVITDKRVGSYLQNTVTGTKPLIVHANGPSKQFLNSIGNYIGGGWDITNGCSHCKPYDPNVPDQSVVVMAIFISEYYESRWLHSTKEYSMVLKEFFANIAKLKYPSAKLHLYLYNNIEISEKVANTFVQDNKDKYASIKRILPKDKMDERQAKELAMEHCIKKDCDYLFSIDSQAKIRRPETISRLIQQNKTIIGPMTSKNSFSTFWGAYDLIGFYAGSLDYYDTVDGNHKGVWNVAYIAKCYMINGSVLKRLKGAYLGQIDADMEFSNFLRYRNIFMFVDNTVDYGHK